jgi:hypothetical protein
LCPGHTGLDGAGAVLITTILNGQGLMDHSLADII